VQASSDIHNHPAVAGRAGPCRRHRSRAARAGRGGPPAAPSRYAGQRPDPRARGGSRPTGVRPPVGPPRYPVINRQHWSATSSRYYGPASACPEDPQRKAQGLSPGRGANYVSRYGASHLTARNGVDFCLQQPLASGGSSAHHRRGCSPQSSYREEERAISARRQNRGSMQQRSPFRDELVFFGLAHIHSPRLRQVSALSGRRPLVPRQAREGLRPDRRGSTDCRAKPRCCFRRASSPAAKRPSLISASARLYRVLLMNASAVSATSCQPLSKTREWPGAWDLLDVGNPPLAARAGPQAVRETASSAVPLGAAPAAPAGAALSALAVAASLSCCRRTLDGSRTMASTTPRPNSPADTAKATV
jgi:hypothetical protein